MTCKNPICEPLLKCKQLMDEFSESMATAAHEAQCLADAMARTKEIERNKRNRRKRLRKKQRGSK